MKYTIGGTTYETPDSLYQFLVSEGHEGSLDDMLRKYCIAQGATGAGSVRDLAEQIGIVYAPSAAANYGTDFAMLIRTTTDNEAVTVSHRNTGGTYNVNVDWGDGATSNYTSRISPDKTHTYATAGDYVVRIGGTVPSINMGSEADASRDNVIKILNFGDCVVNSCTDLYALCRNASNLEAIEQNGINNVSTVVGAGEMFRNCDALTGVQDLSGLSWDACTNFTMNFQECNGVGQNFTVDFSNSSWSNTGSVNAGSMFNNCTGVTGVDLTGVNTVGWNTMVNFFNAATGITSLDVSDIDTANVTTIQNVFNDMFTGGGSVTGLENWDVSNVTNMNNAFRDSQFAFFDISGWDISGVTTFGTFGANSTMTTAVYDAWLINLEANINPAITYIHNGSAKYTSGGAAETARTNLGLAGVTVVDGGAV